MTEDIQKWARQLVQTITRGLSARQGNGIAEVLARLAEQDTSEAAFRVPEPRGLPVLQFLPHCMGEVTRFDPQLAACIAALEGSLQWRQSPAYTDDILGAGFGANYGWAEIIGPHGFFPGSDFLLGMLMLGPNRHYPDHYHPAPELYWPLTSDSRWSADGRPFDVKPQGAIIWHPAMMLHATITRDSPLLALWCWTNNTSIPAKLKWA